jgi:hypothetical protein
MTRGFLLLGTVLLVSTTYMPASAAELGIAGPRHRMHTYVRHERSRYVGCPAYTCSSMYGAYGPFGGSAYWSRYTYGGWY